MWRKANMFYLITDNPEELTCSFAAGHFTNNS